MAGLFGGGSSTTPIVTPEKDAKKGATDIAKLKGQEERRKQYGQSTSFSPDNYFSATPDTTLSNGSLLSLGGTLG